MLKLSSRRSKLVLSSFLVLGLIAGTLQYGLFLSNFDYSAPIVYGIDGILNAVMVQGMVEGDYFPPGVIKSARLGAPGTMTMGDFPTFDGFHLLLMKGISLFTSNAFLICNLYYVLSFLLAGLCFLWTARAFRIQYPFAIAGAVLFAFGQYHLLRFQHLFLCAYYIIPPLIWVIAQSWTEKPLIFKKDDNGNRRFDWKDERLVPVLIITAIGGWSGIYFNAFTLVIATVCAFHAGFFYKSRHAFLSAIFPVVALFASFLIGASPNLAYRMMHGKTGVGARHFSETEVLSLTLPEALLPIGGISNIPWVNKNIAHKYKPQLPGTDAAYIGGWASLGFCIVLLFGFLYNANLPQNLPAQFGIMSIVLLLYALRGGFGFMFSIVVTPQIRALSRIVVFMAPLGLLGICALLSTWIKPRGLAILTGMVMLLLGVVDQVPYQSFTNHPVYLREYQGDQKFFPLLEKQLPPGSSVFQLPVMEFPESGGILGIMDYDPLRPYLHTKKLRWSGGAPSQRETIQLLKNLAAMPINPETIQGTGFSAILIDSKGYSDQGREIHDYLHQKLKREPIVSEDGRWIFFQLSKPSSVSAS